MTEPKERTPAEHVPDAHAHHAHPQALAEPDPSGAPSFLNKWMDRLLGRTPCAFPLTTVESPIRDLGFPDYLHITLGTVDGQPAAYTVQVADEVNAGDPLGDADGRDPRPSPVRGKIASMKPAPDLHGGPSSITVVVDTHEDDETIGGSPAAFERLHPETATREELLSRIRTAGVRTNEHHPRSLADLLEPAGAPVVLLAADQEPGLCGTAALLRERTDDTFRAARLLGRLGEGPVTLAVLEPQATLGQQICNESGAKLLTLPPRYPESLPPLVAGRVGGGARVVALETALAAYDAVAEGRVQDRKVLTVIGPKARVVGNVRAAIGARLSDIVAALGLTVRNGDKIVAGGPLRGVAQYTMDAAVDVGMDGLAIIRADDIVAWSEDPCISCGACIDVCPAQLQVGLISRYSEFALFEECRELDLAHCIGCGLCATVCTARRPLVQLLELARQQLAKQDREREAEALAAAAAEAAADTAAQTEGEA